MNQDHRGECEHADAASSLIVPTLPRMRDGVQAVRWVRGEGRKPVRTLRAGGTPSVVLPKLSLGCGRSDSMPPEAKFFL
jgi:hypothetical protein